MLFTKNGHFADLEKMDPSRFSPELTEKEKSSPYAKYFYQGPAEPAPEVIEAIRPNSAVDPLQATRPSDIYELVKNHGEREVENGYCVMPDGTGYATVLTRFHDITPEIEKAFEHFNPEGDLGYKIWYPGAHVCHLEDGCIEDMGTGINKIQFYTPLTPISFGIEDLNSLDPDAIAIMGGGGRFKPLNAGDDLPFSYMANIHYTRKAGKGFEFRSIFWNGIKVVDGKLEVFINPGQIITEEEMRLVASHCAYEVANNRALMLDWYKNNH